jgi:hypothetical protein
MSVLAHCSAQAVLRLPLPVVLLLLSLRLSLLALHCACHPDLLAQALIVVLLQQQHRLN